MTQQKYEDTLGKLDRLTKRNEAIDILDRKIKELENEVAINKAL